MINSKAFEKFSLDGKVVVITGGAGFLGMQYALGLGETGAKIAVWDNGNHNPNKLPICGLNLTKAGINYSILRVDVTNEKEVEEAVNNTLVLFNRIDVLINNAAMNPAIGSEESQKQFVPYDVNPMIMGDIGNFRRHVNDNSTALPLHNRNYRFHANHRSDQVNVNFFPK